MTSLNHALFLAINASAAPPGWLVALATVFAKYLYYLVPLHMALVWFAGTRFMRFVAITGLLGLVLGLLVSGLIGLLVYTPRPDVVGIGHTLLDHRPSAAFPSNHAIVCLTWAATAAIYGRIGIALAAAALGLLVAWSRVYLGVHFPLDMVGAAVIAAASAFVAARFMTRFGNGLVDLSERPLRLVGLAGTADTPRPRPKGPR